MLEGQRGTGAEGQPYSGQRVEGKRERGVEGGQRGRIAHDQTLCAVAEKLEL